MVNAAEKRREHACLKASLPARGACCDGYEWRDGESGKGMHGRSLVGRTRKRRKNARAVYPPLARVLNGVLGESQVELRDLGHALFDYSGNVFVCTARRGGRVGWAGKGKAERENRR